MVSSVFHKLLRDHQSPIKLISVLKNPIQPPCLIPSQAPHLLHDPLTPPPNHYNSNLDQFRTGDAIYTNSVPIFPSFRFGYCLNPGSSTGPVPDCAGNVVSSDNGRMNWAGWNPNLGQFRAVDAISLRLIPIFPSFPFGYCLNPVSSTGSEPDSAGDVVLCDDGDMMWADSVKKKRKRKMNKHKLKKLRKRLRGKT